MATGSICIYDGDNCAHQNELKFLTEEVRAFCSDLCALWQSIITSKEGVSREMCRRSLRLFWRVIHQIPKHIIIIWLMRSFNSFDKYFIYGKWKQDKGRDCTWDSHWADISRYVPNTSLLKALRWPWLHSTLFLRL